MTRWRCTTRRSKLPRDSLPANIAAGSVLDLMGQGEEARQYFAKAIQVADTPEHKAMAERAMAMSYAFEGNCKKTIQHEQAVFNYYGERKRFFSTGRDGGRGGSRLH